jgi:hypothetical protein
MDMNRRERRHISKSAKKQLEIIEAKKRKMGIDTEEIRIFKTYLWGYLYYIRKGWRIAPIIIIGFMAIYFRYDGLSLSVAWNGKRVACFGFRIRQGMKRIINIKGFRIYVSK